FFTADVSTGAAAQRDFRHVLDRRIGFQLGDLSFEHRTAAVVFVTQVDIDGFDAHCPGSHQHAFQEAVRIAFEVVTILERAGFASVAVHSHQARAPCTAHDAPLTASRGACATQATQAGGFHHLAGVFRIALAGYAFLPQFIPAFDHIFFL